MEAGALDGQLLSNTLWLEQELNWTGLLIEPDPYSYQHLVHKRRKTWTTNSCISTNNLTKKTTFVSLAVRKGYPGHKLYDKSSTFEYGVTMQTKTGQGNEATAFEDTTYFMTHCFPLYSYLLALNVTTVDMLSLDTQGSEVDILKSIPWEKINIRVLIIEMADITRFHTDLVNYLDSKGFILVGHFLDYIFIKKGDLAYTRLTSYSDWYTEAKEVNGSVIITRGFGKQGSVSVESKQ